MPEKLQNIDRGQIKALWESGLPVGTLSKRFGVKPMTIDTWKRRGMWTRGDGRGKPLSEHSLGDLSLTVRLTLARSCLRLSEALCACHIKPGDAKGIGEKVEALRGLAASAEKTFPDWQTSNDKPSVQFNLLIQATTASVGDLPIAQVSLDNPVSLPSTVPPGA